MANTARNNPPRTKQDNQGKDNRGKGPLVDNPTQGRHDGNRRPPLGDDSRASNLGDRGDQPASSPGKAT